MSLSEYKFISPVTLSDEEKLEAMANELKSMEEHYHNQSENGASDGKLAVLAENILEKRTAFEAAGGTYPTL